MNKITIITLADKEYFNLLLTLIKSLDIHFSEFNIFCTLINCSKKEKRKIKNINKNIEIKMENVFFKNKKEKKCYCTNRRAYLFKYLRKIKKGHLVWIDADSIFRKRDDHFKKHILSCDLTMRPKKIEEKRFAAGVIGIGDSSICYSFINDYFKIVNEEKDWMSNQRNLNICYKMYEGKINFKSLDKKYCDVWLSDDGVIWAAKSKLKKSKKYLKEIKKYKD